MNNYKNSENWGYASHNPLSTPARFTSLTGIKRNYSESKRSFGSEINASLFQDEDDDDANEIRPRIKPRAINIPYTAFFEGENSKQTNCSIVEESKKSVEAKIEKINSNKLYFGEQKSIQNVTFLGNIILSFDCSDQIAWENVSTQERLLLVGENDNINVFEVWLDKCLLGFVQQDLSLLTNLTKEEVVQCSITKNSIWNVSIRVYLGKKGRMLEESNDHTMFLDEEDNKTDWKKVSPQVKRAKELLEKLRYGQLRKALIDNLTRKRDSAPNRIRIKNYSPPKQTHNDYAGNIYDPFVRATLIELFDEKLQNGKVSNDSQKITDIFEEYRDKHEKKAILEIDEEEENELNRIFSKEEGEMGSKEGEMGSKEEDNELYRIFNQEEEEIGPETDMFFRNPKLNSLKLKDMPQKLECRLRDYQKCAVNWMLSQEGKFPQLLEKLQPKAAKRLIHPLYEEWMSPTGMRLYLNIYNGIVTDIKPTVPTYTKGGLLADDMGLGKTVMMIALFLSNPRDKIQPRLDSFVKEEQLINSDSSEVDIGSSDVIELPVKKGNFCQQKQIRTELPDPQASNPSAGKTSMGGNLIICPPILRRQWCNEISRHTKQNSLTMLLYDGSHKKLTQEDVFKYDVVIVSYQLLGEEMRRKKGFLINMPWYRVVLDEAHTIRNKKANWSKAIFKLQAKYRWALTGTPTQNKFHDLFSLLHFLRTDPWGLKHSYWTRLIKYVQRQQKIEYLHSALKPIMLRRTKESLSLVDKNDIALPPKMIETKIILLQDHERKFYDNCKEIVYKQFVTLAKRKEKACPTVFSLYQQFMQLRQACDHKMLVGMNKGKVSKENLEGKLQEFLKKKGIEMDVENHMDVHRNVSVKALKARIEDLKKDQIEDCSVCLLPPNTIAFTVCGHIFCEECISECLDKNPICPVCKKNTETNDILVFDRETPELSAENYKPSTKSIGVIEELVKIAEKKEKCVCFTQWIGMMNILGFEMSAKGIKFVRLDGKCSNKKRTQILAQFLEDNETTVLMVSLMMGGVGLNLTKANHVLLVEPWWNPGVEIQAIDRVHRIGQNKPVHVTRYICADTIEEKILNLQEHKKGILDLTLAQCSKEDFKNMGYFLGVEFDPHGFK